MLNNTFNILIKLNRNKQLNLINQIRTIIFQRKMVKNEAGDLVPQSIDLKELDPLPEFVDEREKLWLKFKKRHEDELAAKTVEPIKVEVTDKNNEKRVVDAESWRSTPFEIAKKISPKSWLDTLVIAKVNGQLWDLDRVLEDNCSLQFLTFEDNEGQQVFWHSSAHILGESLERLFGGQLCYGPPIDNGFYYDIFMCNHCALKSEETEEQKQQENSKKETEKVQESSETTSSVSSLHFNSIESVMKRVTNEKQPFERLELTKDELFEMFAYNQFKLRILKEKVKDDKTTVYRCGTLIDLCRGPHVRHTGYVKAFKVTKSSSSYWEGKADSDRLQRVYGISFPDSKQLKEWQKFQEEAAKRDHRKLGREQDLFFFHPLSPGSCFFTPRGAHIYNTLIEFIRGEYRKRGFTEVITPNIYNAKLWEKSGHWEHYSDNMFKIDVEKDQFGLKPMNCPGHCLLFDNSSRSWRDLPMRLADFGVLHRNELSGTLGGLTRVRRFQQDDAHIFCTPEQITEEICNALDFLRSVYSVFGFTFNLCLSTRPEKFLGEIEAWNHAEEALSNALNKLEMKWTLNPGDGAFYGPKIDITIMDAIKRPHQCATIQLDFQLPLRFNLTYSSDDMTKKHPVIIHRAIYGSIERFIAILTENFAGKWPFWLSPRQVIVLPIGPSCLDYAEKVKKTLYLEGFFVDIEDDPGLTINKKVRNAQLANYNFILVVGEKEKSNESVNVRTRDNKIHGEHTLASLIEKFKIFKESKTLNAEDF